MVFPYIFVEQLHSGGFSTSIHIIHVRLEEDDIRNYLFCWGGI